MLSKVCTQNMHGTIAKVKYVFELIFKYRKKLKLKPAIKKLILKVNKENYYLNK